MSWGRRGFIKSSVGAGLAFSIKPFRRIENVKYRTALIGSGWWGMNILREAMRAGSSRIVALCDVDHNQLGPAVSRAVGVSEVLR